MQKSTRQMQIMNLLDDNESQEECQTCHNGNVCSDKRKIHQSGYQFQKTGKKESEKTDKRVTVLADFSANSIRAT